MKKDGFNTTYREIPGPHYWFLWRDFLAHYAQIAFQPAANREMSAFGLLFVVLTENGTTNRIVQELQP